MRIRTFEVLADTRTQGLYFILLERLNGTSAGVLTYQMGWVKPKAITKFPPWFGILKAPDLAESYRHDPKKLIGSFNSTLPQ